MKAITIMQPWATLIALGEKQFETRSWSTNYRGEIAIHAAKSIDKEACHHPDIQAILERRGYTINDLPTGAIVAKAKLIGCYQSIKESEQGYTLSNGQEIREPEWLLGDFEPGRYAWQLDTVQLLKTPIVATGKQRLWEWSEQPSKTAKKTYKIIEDGRRIGTIETQDIHDFIRTHYSDIADKIAVNESKKEIRFQLSLVESIARSKRLTEERQQRK